MPGVDGLERDILAKYAEQFAENQNHHQALIVRLLTAILLLLGAYGYATINEERHVRATQATLRPAAALPAANNAPCVIYAIGGSAPTPLSQQRAGAVRGWQYLMLSAVIAAIFAGLFRYVCQAAYGFRRDMYVVWRIRDDAGWMSRTLIGGTYRSGRSPTAERFGWIPELFQALLLLPLIGVVAVAFATVLYTVSYEIRWWEWLPVACLLIPVLVIWHAYRKYRDKTVSVHRHYRNWSIARGYGDTGPL